MKPEDKRVFDAFVKKRGYDDGYSALIADDAFRFALAHRDAQPAVAVNEQLLEAAKELDATFDLPVFIDRTARTKMRAATAKFRAAIAAAEAEKAKGVCDA